MIRIQPLGGEDLLEKEMAIHSSVLLWKIGAWWTVVHGVTKSQTRLSVHAVHHTHTKCTCVFSHAIRSYNYA